MPSAQDLVNLNRIKSGNQNAVVPLPPPLPDDVKKRFPTLAQWEKDFADYMQKKVVSGLFPNQH